MRTGGFALLGLGLILGCDRPEHTLCEMGLVDLRDIVQADRRNPELSFEIDIAGVRGSATAVLREVGCSWWEYCETHELTFIPAPAFPASYIAHIPSCSDEEVPQVWSKLLGVGGNTHIFALEGRLRGHTCFRALGFDMVPGPVIEVDL